MDQIGLGEDFVDRVRGAIRTCRAVLVVIGRGWVNVTKADGSRRLDDPDPVRLELREAMDGPPLVLPVLVDGAAMPSADVGLPVELRRLPAQRPLSSAERWSAEIEAHCAIGPPAEPHLALPAPIRAHLPRSEKTVACTRPKSMRARSTSRRVRPFTTLTVRWSGVLTVQDPRSDSAGQPRLAPVRVFQPSLSDRTTRSPQQASGGRTDRAGQENGLPSGRGLQDQTWRDSHRLPATQHWGSVVRPDPRELRLGRDSR